MQVVKATGAGFMGLELAMMPVTVYTAHLVFGVALGLLCRTWIRDRGWLLAPRHLRPNTTTYTPAPPHHARTNAE